MKTTTHRHRAKHEKVRCYSYPIPGARYNPAAHGNIMVVRTCSCGAIQRVNENQGYVERGPWDPTDAQELA